MKWGRSRSSGDSWEVPGVQVGGGGSLEAVVSAGVVRKRTESAGVGDKAEVTHCWPGGEGGQRITRVNNDPSAGDYISG